MPNPDLKIRKSFLYGLTTLLFWIPLPWLYFAPPRFLQGRPLAAYAIVLFVSGMSSAALALFFLLKSRISIPMARVTSLLFLLGGIVIYQFSGLAPNWDCLGKQVYVTTVNAAGGNCTTTCTNNDVKPCSGWSTCWDKFVSCDASGKDQDGRPCQGCCFSCQVVCEPDPDQPPTITSNISCSQPGDNGWCRGTAVLTLTASDPQGYPLTISGDIGGVPFTCAASNTCFQPIPQGQGTINYRVTAANSGMSADGSTTWKVDATLPSINGTLSGTIGSNGWYLGQVGYNGSASDSLSGLAGLTCTLDSVTPGSCSSISVAGEGAHVLNIMARDQAGNVQNIAQNIFLDSQNPVLTAGINGTLGSNNWYTSAVLNASASDPAPGSGLSALEYNLDSSGWTTFPTSGMLDLSSGIHNIEIRAVDKSGRTVSSSRSYSLDNKLPAISLNPSGTLGLDNWYTTTLSLTASANDETSGMDVFEYNLNNSTWTTYAAPLTLGNGVHAITFWAQDKAGLVRQVDETYKVDTDAPQIAGNLSGVPGANGWYTSQVTISASATDPAPGSGLEALTYILNGELKTTYTSPITLSDGSHTIQFDANDKAGLTGTITQSVKVDTIAPSLNVSTTLPSWSKGTIALQGTASDAGSGLSRIEISTDGTTWQTVNGTTAWNYAWNTTTSGVHQVRVRVSDHAGLITEQNFKAGVDNRVPKINLPDSWLQWDTVTLDVWDNDSGLSEVRIEISDPEGRWKTRKIDLDPNTFPLNFKWDRRFGDDTIAPLGAYPVKVIAYDNTGNMMQAGATVNILLGILPAGPAATPQPYTRVDSTPAPVSAPVAIATQSALPAPVTSIFGSTPEPVEQTQDDHSAQTDLLPSPSVTSRAAPTQTTVMDWLEAIFVPHAAEETVTDVSTTETNPNTHWDATLAAMAAAVAAYTLAEKRKRDEEERPLSNFLQKILNKKNADMKAREAEEREIALARLQAEMEDLGKPEETILTANKEDLLEPEMVSYSAKPQEWKTTYNAYMAQKAMEGYRAGEKEIYAVAQQDQPKKPNWWEKTKSFTSENIIQPINASIYKPIIKPAIETASNGILWLNGNIYQPYIKPEINRSVENFKHNVSWLNENIYQPHIKPEIDRSVENFKHNVSWLNENIYQPHIKPEIDRRAENFKHNVGWLNENIYQPYIKPEIDRRAENFKQNVGWLNENIYQPYIKPEIDRGVDNLKSSMAWLDETIYQPIFQPVVDDIVKHIYQPVSNKTEVFWAQYGEWVHGCLDAAGFVPGFGEIADGLNGLIYLGEGRYIEASVSLLAMVPLFGDLAKAGKLTIKAGQEILEEAVEIVVKETVEELTEKIARETVTEVAGEIVERTVRETGEELAAITVKESLEEVAERTLKEASEGLSDKVVRESLEEATEKTLRETGKNFTISTEKELMEQAPEKIVSDAASDATAETIETITQKTSEITSKQINEEVAKLVNSLATKYGDVINDIIHIYGDDGITLLRNYGDEAVDFIKRSEQLNINPLEVLDNPPFPGQTLEGWLLKIDNPDNPVNVPLKLNQTDVEIIQTRKEIIQNPDSKLFSIGYGKDAKIPFDKLGDHFDGHPMSFISMPPEKWAVYENSKAYGDFWEVNRNAIEWGVEERKIFVLNRPYEMVTDLDPKHTRRFSLAEIRQIEMPTNGYTMIDHGEYAVFVPDEIIDTYKDFLPLEIQLS